MALAATVALSCGVARADSVRDGDQALKAGHLDDALKYYEQAARDGNASGVAGMGLVYVRRGRFELAMRTFSRALQMDPNQSVAYYGEGEVQRRQGKCQDAVPFFEKATSLDHRFPEAEMGLGNCLVAVGQFDRGVAELSKGLKWGPEWAPRFLVALGTAWATRDSLRVAGVEFTRAREMAPSDPAVRKSVGEFYVQRGTWALAIPELRAAVSLDSTDAEAQGDLARALFYAERYEEALEVYEGLTSQDPDYAPGQLGIGDLLYRAGEADPKRYAEARVHLRAYVRLEPTDPKGWSLLGRTLYHTGEPDSALVAMQKADSLGDRTPDLYSTMGLAYAARRQWDKSLAAFQKGEPGLHEYPVMAQIYEITGHPERADSLYRMVLSRDTTSAAAGLAFNESAKIRYRAKDYAQAESLFARGLKLDPRNGEAWFFQGLCFKELDRGPEGLDALRRAVALDTTKADRYFWLGVVADGQKRQDEAQQAFARTVELDSTGALAGPADRELGYYDLLKKRWLPATTYLERAVRLDPRDAQAWLWLAQGYQNAGDRAKAAEGYRHVLGLLPQNDEAKKGLMSLGGASPGAHAPK